MQSAYVLLSMLTRGRPSTGAFGLMLILLFSVSMFPQARADDISVVPPSVGAYYFDDLGQLLVVEGNPRRQIKTMPNRSDWITLMFSSACDPVAETDPNKELQIGGKAVFALYLLFDGAAAPKLIATEDLKDVSRKVKPPRKVAEGPICCCALIPCPGGRKCCPCASNC